SRPMKAGQISGQVRGGGGHAARQESGQAACAALHPMDDRLVRRLIVRRIPADVHPRRSGTYSVGPRRRIRAMTSSSGARLTMRVEEAARLLGISRGLAYELVNRGELPALRLGRRLVVPTEALEDLVASAGNAGRGTAPTTNDDTQEKVEKGS